jgi:ferredoxin
MRVAVDLTLCSGYANCVVAAPDIFDVTSSGKAVLLMADVDGGLEADAREAARVCPAAAIQLTDRE